MPFKVEEEAWEKVARAHQVNAAGDYLFGMCIYNCDGLEIYLRTYINIHTLYILERSFLGSLLIDRLIESPPRFPYTPVIRCTYCSSQYTSIQWLWHYGCSGALFCTRTRYNVGQHPNSLTPKTNLTRLPLVLLYLYTIIVTASRNNNRIISWFASKFSSIHIVILQFDRL